MVQISELDALLGLIGWNRSELARRLNVSKPLVHFWAVGKQPAPQSVLDWLFALANAMAGVPASGWTRQAAGKKPGSLTRRKKRNGLVKSPGGPNYTQ